MDPTTDTPAPATPPSPDPPPSPDTPPTGIPRRPRGKIARLAPPLRERLNQMLDEGLEYAELIDRLGPDGAHLTQVDVCRWYKSGHQDWLKNQLWLDQTRSRLDFAIDVLAENDGPTVHQANLHVAATQLIQTLARSGEILLTENPGGYVAVVNSVSRLSHEALSFEKYREACVLARAELAKLRDPDRKPTEKETLAIVDRLDQILGFK